VQLAKLADGLTTDRYAAGNESELAVCVQPRMFKALVGKGHPEFSSARQQDAQEYLGHFLGMLQRMERKAGAAVFAPFSPLLAFSQEERIVVDGLQVVVEHEAAGVRERAQFHRQWVRIEPLGGEHSLIAVSGQGKSIQVGRYVRPERREALAQELRRAVRMGQSAV
jgi:hypothetical protein